MYIIDLHLKISVNSKLQNTNIKLINKMEKNYLGSGKVN